MKKIIIAIIIAIASAMSSNAQVLTSETIKNVYETVSHQQKSDFVFNAKWTANDIITMYIYKKVSDRNGILMLKPHLKYEYAYAADGTLTSRVAYRQSDSQDWTVTTVPPTASTNPWRRWFTCWLPTTAWTMSAVTIASCPRHLTRLSARRPSLISRCFWPRNNLAFDYKLVAIN